jgi:hypothetical protein
MSRQSVWYGVHRDNRPGERSPGGPRSSPLPVSVSVVTPGRLTRGAV